jgi:hypothetical protein
MAKNRLQELAGIKIPTIKFYATFLEESDLKSNGQSHGKPSILCSRTEFPWLDEFEVGSEIPFNYKEVIFKKLLNEVFIDDEFDLDEFGIDPEKQDIAYKEIGKNNLYPVSNLIKFGLKFDENLSWYGCYVNDIKPNEIISQEIKTNENE